MGTRSNTRCRTFRLWAQFRQTPRLLYTRRVFKLIKDWYQRYLTDPQAVALIVLLLPGIVIFWVLGNILAPVFAAIILAYLLDSPVELLEKKLRVARLSAVCVIFLLFLALLGFSVLLLLPLITQQISEFLDNMPAMINNTQELILRLQRRYPQLIPEDILNQLIANMRSELASMGRNMLSFWLSSIPTLITVLVYLLLVPLMIFFLLKDKTLLLRHASNLFPSYRGAAKQLWDEMDAQMGNYIRGKSCEIIIIGAGAFIIFYTLELEYSVLLAIAVGLSVLIPYIGGTIVTLPVVLVAYAQWGLDSSFYWTLAWYLILQFLDGNVLVPILFSEAVNLHPVTIVVAILICGGLWGFWGVFFAIPIATLVKTLINIWPENHAVPTETSQDG